MISLAACVVSMVPSVNLDVLMVVQVLELAPLSTNAHATRIAKVPIVRWLIVPRMQQDFTARSVASVALMPSARAIQGTREQHVLRKF